MLTNRHMFGLHRPTHARVTLTALQGIGKREKGPRRWPRNVANLKKLARHMAILTSVFENQKVDMKPQLSGLLPTNMGEELPTEGPLSMGALYSPIWALSQKGVGGGGVCLHTLYIYIVVSNNSIPKMIKIGKILQKLADELIV